MFPPHRSCVLGLARSLATGSQRSGPSLSDCAAVSCGNRNTGGDLCRPLGAGSRARRSLRGVWRERPRVETPCAAKPAASAWSLTPQRVTTVEIDLQRDLPVVTTADPRGVLSRVSPRSVRRNQRAMSTQSETRRRSYAADQTTYRVASKSCVALSGWIARRTRRCSPTRTSSVSPPTTCSTKSSTRCSARDKEFLAWRTEHSESFVPPSPAMQPTRKRRARGVASTPRRLLPTSLDEPSVARA